MLLDMDMELTDQVMHFAANGDHVQVTFRQNAAAYRISSASETFVRLVSEIAAAWKSKQPVTVKLEGTVEIVSVTT